VRAGRLGALVTIACAGLGSLGMCLGPLPALASAATADVSRAADSPPAGHPSAGAKSAPSDPPLAPGGEEAAGGAEEESAGAATSSAGDPLISNGLGSPLCHAAGGEQALSQVSDSNCRTSGFEAAPSPTGNYGFDVHINTGVGEWTNDGDAMFQDLLELAWTVLVATVHAIVVMLEWCYTIDLLDSPAMGGVARGLRETQATFTQPWLVVVLSVASVLAVYHGLVRRRVAETLGQALVMLAMMAGGLWVIMDPTGTVGSLGGWANEAGLGALGAVAGGTPQRAERTLADGMGTVFTGEVARPWCYLEFGNVGWCSDPARLDPRLRATALAAAAHEGAQDGCPAGAGSASVCAQSGSPQAGALEHSAEQLRDARTNGALFLALPANQSTRNSINAHGSLFNALCGGSELPCRGPTVAEAEFRTQHGTAWRFMGLVFIWAGVLGMLLLLGFIGMHLLGAAIASLIYLLLAPAAVLAPALGDGGRAVFRAWATRLLGAVMAKLIYSFALGVMLLMEQILTVDLTALGWFSQWLLISTMWWGAYIRRHQLLGFAQAGEAHRHEPRAIARRVSGALEGPRMVMRGAGWVKRKRDERNEEQAAKKANGEGDGGGGEGRVGGGARPGGGGRSGGGGSSAHGGESAAEKRRREAGERERALARSRSQVRDTFEADHREATARLEDAPKTEELVAGARAQLDRVESERARALASGDGRRGAELGHRAERIEADAGRSQQGLNAARDLAGSGQQAKGILHGSEQWQNRSRFLDAQAALAAGAQALGPRAGERRDYPALSGLAGFSREEYERLDPRGRRAARLQVDRELQARRGLNETVRELTTTEGTSQLGRRGGAARSSGAGDGITPVRPNRPGIDARRPGGRGGSGTTRSRESSVMRDAHEVAARRKRQLGRDPEH
jgi:uncharacterized membrane protein YgcG